MLPWNIYPGKVCTDLTYKITFSLHVLTAHFKNFSQFLRHLYIAFQTLSSVVWQIWHPWHLFRLQKPYLKKNTKTAQPVTRVNQEEPEIFSWKISRVWLSKLKWNTLQIIMNQNEACRGLNLHTSSQNEVKSTSPSFTFFLQMRILFSTVLLYICPL